MESSFNETLLMEMNSQAFSRLAEAHFFLHSAPEKTLTALPDFKLPAVPHLWFQVASLAEGSWWTPAIDELQVAKSQHDMGELRPLRINGQVQWQNNEGVYSRLVHNSRLCCWLPQHSLADAYIPQHFSWGTVSADFPTWPPSKAKIATKTTKRKQKVTVRKSQKKGGN